MQRYSVKMSIGSKRSQQPKNALLKAIERIKEAGTLGEIKDVREIEGYREYYRVRIGEYRLGIKITGNAVELIRFLHRKDIYRRFP